MLPKRDGINLGLKMLINLNEDSLAPGNSLRRLSVTIDQTGEHISGWRQASIRLRGSWAAFPGSNIHE